MVMKLSLLLFLLLVSFCKMTSQMVDIEGNSYPTAKIGNQIWTTQNLQTTTFRNGDPIPEARTDAEWKAACSKKKPAWCFVGSNPNSLKIYGKIYNQYAVLDKRGLAPLGWHIPSDKEWDILLSNVSSQKTVGFYIKSTSTWSSNRNGNNASGLDIVATGTRGGMGNWMPPGLTTVLWSTTRKGDALWTRRLGHWSNEVERQTWGKDDGFSVRCISDSFYSEFYVFANGSFYKNPSSKEAPWTERINKKDGWDEKPFMEDKRENGYIYLIEKGNSERKIAFPLQSGDAYILKTDKYEAMFPIKRD
jgi:uncharacterized protein (TIGR02145 family)